jgi:hypothetical protein
MFVLDPGLCFNLAEIMVSFLEKYGSSTRYLEVVATESMEEALHETFSATKIYGSDREIKVANSTISLKSIYSDNYTHDPSTIWIDEENLNLLNPNQHPLVTYLPHTHLVLFCHTSKSRVDTLKRLYTCTTKAKNITIIVVTKSLYELVSRTALVLPSSKKITYLSTASYTGREEKGRGLSQAHRQIIVGFKVSDILKLYGETSSSSISSTHRIYINSLRAYIKLLIEGSNTFILIVSDDYYSDWLLFHMMFV